MTTSNPQQYPTEGQIIRELAEKTVAVHTVLVAGARRSLLVYRMPDGEIETLDVEQYQPAPDAIVAAPSFDDAESFSNYVGLFKSEASRLFYDRSGSMFTAILDYHARDVPSWGRHSPTLTLQKSEQWQMWYGRNKQYSSQVSFCRFLEENQVDVINPSGASLLEMCLTFEALKTVSYREATRLKSGTTQFAYNEELKTGTVEIPDTITIKIPVFHEEAPQEVILRLRFKIEDQRLQLAYEFIRPQRTIEEAAAKICIDIEVATGIPVLLGRR